jgi:hypothetical protein
MAASAQCQHSTGRRRRLPAPANLSKTRVSRLKKKPQSFHVKTHHLTATHKSHAPRHSGASKYKVRNGKRDRRICTAREAVRGGGERREGKLLVVATRHRRRGGRSGERERERWWMAVEYHCCEPGFFVQIAIIVVLVLFVGLMSGLTLGLMSLSLVDLEVLAKSGTEKDRKHAGTVLPPGRRGLARQAACRRSGSILFCNFRMCPVWWRVRGG